LHISYLLSSFCFFASHLFFLIIHLLLLTFNYIPQSNNNEFVLDIQKINEVMYFRYYHNHQDKQPTKNARFQIGFLKERLRGSATYIRLSSGLTLGLMVFLFRRSIKVFFRCQTSVWIKLLIWVSGWGENGSGSLVGNQISTCWIRSSLLIYSRPCVRFIFQVRKTSVCEGMT
jgi:hypothetical protein